MPDKDHVEFLIIGSGEAGKYLAWTMAKAGRRTALVERGLIGGACPNIACLPSKNIIHSAKVAELTRQSPLNQEEFGLERGHNCLKLGREVLSDLREMRIEDPNDCGWKLFEFV